MKKTKLIITVDTEAYAQGALPIEADIYGQCGRERYGVEKIMDLCDAVGCKATFFVDAVEHHLFGKHAMAALCRCIDGRHHDVQLHAHPNIVPGHPHKLMSQYDYVAQKAIIETGRELVGEWTGKAPLAFRAGSYGANLVTIEALSTAGFKIDSSYFSCHKNCALSRELHNRYKNKLFSLGTITEIPVTVYRLLNMLLYDEYSKIDINACADEEIRFVIDKMAGRAELVILFLHSFSFLRWDARKKQFVPDQYNVTKFESILRAISHRDDMQVMTIHEFYRQMAALPLAVTGREDYIPTSNFINNFHRLARRYIRQ